MARRTLLDSCSDALNRRRTSQFTLVVPVGVVLAIATVAALVTLVPRC